ncbi:hypothetical protein A8950_3501 [Dongia mobilis]|uniref:Uncharacterized protein n=1 Tax=Dongia mobilis TaxID=578943 RepID=A0A4R6WIJ5_9PROT|nr:hypothetical protein [Dongia mobilis]TDQ78449.1 hypothetical protein A8950_3501 [Dongia mobilis]
MMSNKTLSILFGGLLFIGTTSTALSQTDTQDHDAHHPEEQQPGPTAPPAGATSPSGMPGNMPGMGMMTPEMMQMMQRMMGQGGMPGMMGGMPDQSMPGGGMGSGMMGPSMMGQMSTMDGMMMCPMMRMMTTGQAAKSMLGTMENHGNLIGTPLSAPVQITEAQVRALLEQDLIRLGNPRLKLGEVAGAADGSITAEIVTLDGSLVQKLAFNRYPGLVRQIE